MSRVFFLQVYSINYSVIYWYCHILEIDLFIVRLFYNIRRSIITRFCIEWKVDIRV